MKLEDEGLYLFGKKHGEKFVILNILSKNNGLIKGLYRISKKNFFLVNLDLITFELNYKNKDTYGFIKFEQKKTSKTENNFFNLLKASASELCMKLLPIWETNNDIYNSLYKLTFLTISEKKKLVNEYVSWEFKLLESLGYGLNLKECVVTGQNEPYFISPKSGNCVSYDVGHKYSSKLFVIPGCLKNNFINSKYEDLIQSLKISGYFLNRILDSKQKFIFRDQFINNI